MSELRELDVQVGKTIFGIKKPFKPLEVSSGGLSPYGSEEDWHYIPSGKSPRTHMIDSRPLPRFSSDATAAMRVVERLRNDDKDLEVEMHTHGDSWVVQFAADLDGAGYQYQGAGVSAETLPLAICRAALEAVKEKAKAASG